MNDLELAQWVAKYVMGWRIYKCESAYFDSYCNADGEGEGPVQHWHPHQNWNQAMEVVQAMREKGWFFHWDESPDNRVRIGFSRETIAEVIVSVGQEIKAILQSAKKAIEENPSR